MILQTRIMNKRDSSENWNANNPVLLDGEIAVVDGERMKIGNGINRYSELPFFLESQSIFVPGMIMLWSGSVNNIPTGWVLCDGFNGTPDLTDRFVLGAGKTYNVGDTGGEEMHTLTIEEIPSHNHTGSTESAGGHTHQIGTDKDASYTSSGACWSVHGASTGADYYNGSTSSNGDHTHLFTTNDIGGEQAHNNMPPYYALCYIMKI